MTDEEFETVVTAASIAEQRGSKLAEAYRGTDLGDDYKREQKTLERAAYILRTEARTRGLNIWQRFGLWMGVGA